jgi:predicted MFS family arabinose efflux permease
MKTVLRNYIKTFEGLSKEVWWLSLITFVNRFGAMVIPFLSLYLNESLEFTKPMIGWVMTAYGLGSVVGSWLGGKLADKIGYYKTILYSLIFTGINFIWVLHIESFWSICVAFFFLIIVADMGRPAFYVALSAYSKPENKTRSLTLLRLAINLGMGAGPAIGGIIIANIGYDYLFYIDGITCLLAALLMTQILNPKRVVELDSVAPIKNPLPPYKDKRYMWFLVSFGIFGLVFMQIFSLVPVYYREIHVLSEDTIGYLMGLNGLIIVLFEMPLIAYMEHKRWSYLKNTIFGLALVGLSYTVLLWDATFGILVLMVVLITVGEMIVFPFSNKIAYDRAKMGKQGAYMGLYTMSFSISHIFGHNGSMQITERFGYDTTWTMLCGLIVISILILVILLKNQKTATL